MKTFPSAISGHWNLNLGKVLGKQRYEDDSPKTHKHMPKKRKE